MTPLKIGARPSPVEIADHRDRLFGADRHIETQGFRNHASLTSEFEDRVVATLAALCGFHGRLGMYGPFEGLDMDNKDPELCRLITARYLRALDAAERIGARQMVLHSPYTR